jgi:catechol 2,3-dioxygenase-like lactoylglutathione lyase family enzyme
MSSEREPRALPGYAFVDHVGFSVPDLDAAVEFFTAVFGAREPYRSSRRGEGRFMTETFEAPPDSSFTLAMLRLEPSLNLELFQWEAPDRRAEMPKASDVGGHHLCVYVDDVEGAYEGLRRFPGVRVLGNLKTVGPGSPVSGTRWTYFVTPWGLQIEIVNRAEVASPPDFVVPRK